MVCIKKLYMVYFGFSLGDQDNTRGPLKICKKCCLALHNWLNKQSSMPFVVPMIWREPKDCCPDCCFCLRKTKNFFFKIAYSNLDSARTPVPNDESMPLPVPPKDGLDAMDCSANDDNFDKFISVLSMILSSEFYRF